MKTIILQEPGRFQLAETPPPPSPGPGEALVRIHRVGICGSDIHAFKGNQPFFTYPRVVGHELGVEIVAVGPNDQGLAAGDRCAVEPYLNCGRCIACRRGKTNCCTSLQVLGVHVDGGMRERMTVPTAKLHRSRTLPLDQLALVEMLTIGAHAVRRAELDLGENVLVIGAGPIGLATVQFAHLVGARVSVLEVSEWRREFCRRHLGVARCLDGTGDTGKRLEEMLAGDLPTTVFDATGSPKSMMQAVQYVANGGKLVYVSLVQADLTFRDPELHRRELTLIRSRNALAADFAWVMQMLEDGRVDLVPWITHRAPAENMVGEFPGWLDPQRGIVKAVVEF
ncbi:MAG TPA: zinc-binding alcohol dehydrogenase family protein [Candidatus Acidoferrum sp.]|nr:zinc-binding alcohol dehydrogenase family protein [Candidatus Acidoferrum sp.]